LSRDWKFRTEFVRFEVSTAVTMMIIIFWEMIIIRTELLNPVMSSEVACVNDILIFSRGRVVD
jgi:hypothetical protein